MSALLLAKWIWGAFTVVVSIAAWRDASKADAVEETTRRREEVMSGYRDAIKEWLS
ncbi:MAG: hypothetical protein WD825_17170 [Gemmatimonadaceae bacterium]